jgi:hypothetical protein
MAFRPAEGPLAKEVPTSVNDIKLIISGKFVENGKQLRGARNARLGVNAARACMVGGSDTPPARPPADYRKEMGDVKPDVVVTFHVVVRLNAGAKNPGAPPGPAPARAALVLRRRQPGWP